MSAQDKLIQIGDRVCLWDSPDFQGVVEALPFNPYNPPRARVRLDDGSRRWWLLNDLDRVKGSGQEVIAEALREVHEHVDVPDGADLADIAAKVALDVLRGNGFAVVEKPEPDETEDGVTDWECAPYRISTLEAYPGEVFPAYLGEPEEPLTPQGARELAAALLAAADAAERGES